MNQIPECRHYPTDSNKTTSTRCIHHTQRRNKYIHKLYRLGISSFSHYKAAHKKGAYSFPITLTIYCYSTTITHSKSSTKNGKYLSQCPSFKNLMVSAIIDNRMNRVNNDRKQDNLPIIRTQPHSTVRNQDQYQQNTRWILSRFP